MRCLAPGPWSRSATSSDAGRRREVDGPTSALAGCAIKGGRHGARYEEWLAQEDLAALPSPPALLLASLLDARLGREASALAQLDRDFPIPSPASTSTAIPSSSSGRSAGIASAALPLDPVSAAAFSTATGVSLARVHVLARLQALCEQSPPPAWLAGSLAVVAGAALPLVADPSREVRASAEAALASLFSALPPLPCAACARARLLACPLGLASHGQGQGQGQQQQADAVAQSQVAVALLRAVGASSSRLAPCELASALPGLLPAALPLCGLT